MYVGDVRARGSHRVFSQVEFRRCQPWDTKFAREIVQFPSEYRYRFLLRYNYTYTNIPSTRKPRSLAHFRIFPKRHCGRLSRIHKARKFRNLGFPIGRAVGGTAIKGEHGHFRYVLFVCSSLVKKGKSRVKDACAILRRGRRRRPQRIPTSPEECE